MKTLKRGEVLFTSDSESDRCRLSFTVDDAKLGEKLEALHRRQMQLVYKLNKRYGSDGSAKFVWCVSHPHGLPKRIMFGKIGERRGLGRGFYQYVYSADTCSGTSGSAIWELGNVQSSSSTLLRLGIYHEDAMHQLLGHGPDDQESAKAAVEYKKHPGHKTFIPVSELTQNHLPEGYQDDNDFFEFIKVTADLTVRLQSWDTSSRMQADGSNCGASGGMTRTATGMIWDVYAKDGVCKCSDCKDQANGSQKYWECTILTSKRALCDNGVPDKISIDLFYNAESRKNGTLKTVHGEVDNTYNTVYYCRLWFATCDTELVKKLEDLSRPRNRLPDKLKEHYSQTMSCNLMWIDSHPHGLPKHVTFGEIQEGQWTRGWRLPAQHGR